jgi:hypothetical protein
MMLGKRIDGCSINLMPQENHYSLEGFKAFIREDNKMNSYPTPTLQTHHFHYQYKHE